MKRIIKLIIAVIVIILTVCAAIFCFFFIGKAKIPEKITWGIDFSQMQAESLGLDWKEAYIEIIDDLGVKNIKIHTQWDWVEGKRGEFYFNDIDWQLKTAKEKEVKVIYVVGLKSGRWPECHTPKWASEMPEKDQKEAILNYIKKVVERYKNNSEISYWQVENEPLFNFGECPEWYYENDNFLREEVELVKSIDPSRQVIVSDTGEGSFWLKPAKIGDIVGTTMYREAWVHITEALGFNFRYLFSPVFYSRKALLVKTFFHKDVICIELQAEPWAQKPFQSVPLKEQLKTMNLEKFKENVKFAKETGLDTFYFWGVEWWYWMKEKQNQPEIWLEAQKIF